MKHAKRLQAAFCALLFLALSLLSCGKENDRNSAMEDALSRAFPVTGALPSGPDKAAGEQPIETAAETEDEPLVLYSDKWMAWFREQCAALEEEFPAGAYWNHKGKEEDYLGVTNTPCNHHDLGPAYCNIYTCASTTACGWSYGTQCAGFAGMLSDRIFGADAPVTIFYDYDAIRPGDQARINNNYHTVFILEKTDEYVVVAECNAGGMNDCKIAWGRTIPRDKMDGFYLTRAE